MNKKLGQANQAIMQTKVESEVKIGQVEESNRAQVESMRIDFGNKCRDLGTTVSEMQGQGQRNQERIEGLQ